MAGPLSLSERGPEPEHSPFGRTPPPELPRGELEFTTYLDAVCVRLRPLAPEAWVADLRAELACHLECTADAYEELGKTRPEAVTSACHSLGEPAKQARGWERYWTDKAREPLRKTVLRAVSYFSAATIVHAAILIWFGDQLFSEQRVLDPAIPNALLLPLLAGVFTARRARGRRTVETMGATAGAALTVAALTALLTATLPGPDPNGARTLLWVTTAFFWLPLGTAAAGIAGMLRSRRERRRLQRGS